LFLYVLATGLIGLDQSWTKQYDFVVDCNCGLALVEKNGKFGYVSEQGKLLVSLIYEVSMVFSEDRAAVMVGGSDVMLI